MKGKSQVITALNTALTAEIGAIVQYIIHANMQDNWGFSKLSKNIAMGHAKEEMGHVDLLIERILFLEGVPKAGVMDKVNIGPDVPVEIQNDLAGEYTAIDIYRNGIDVCTAHDDPGTRKLFEKILKDEERHANDLETQESLIQKIGLQNYLIEQI